MRIRREIFLVFVLASVLVFAGFSASEKAYAGGEPPVIAQIGLGDFYCWFTSNPESEIHLFEIEDQFGTVMNSNWEQLEYCTAANKRFDGEDFVSPFDSGFPSFTTQSPLNQHYQGWVYPDEFEGPALEQTVLLSVPQLDHNFEAEILFYDSVLFPAIKFNPSEQVSANENHHWNCYGISAPSLGERVDIFTQHGSSTENLLSPFLMCAPMIKDDTFFPDNTLAPGGLDGPHMVCYDLSPIDRTNIINREVLPGSLIDQLGLNDFIIADPEDSVEKFCVPAIKTSLTVGGFNVPIDQTALILAGVSSVSMWMIPVVIAGVGIGIFVIKRRK